MSFYVTLPSNSSQGYFDNTATEFTTQLQFPIRLNGPYEVSLVEITYDHCWDVDLGSIFYFHSDKHVSFGSKIILRDGENFNSFLGRINQDIGPKIFEYEILKLKKEYPQIEVTDIFIRFQKRLKNGGKNYMPILVYKDQSIMINTMAPDHYFYFQGLFGEIMGVNNKLLNTRIDNVPVDNFDENFYFIRSLYVYTDIVKYQYVGDSLAPLLRNVVVPNNKLTTQNIVYDSPHYLPVNKSTIETINIRITDELGNNIKFRRGKTIVKLHFRPVKNGF